MSRDPIDDPALAPLLRALTAPADERELDGLDGAVQSFRAAQASSPHHPARRPSMILTLAGAKLGATLAALAVGVGGAATVAYVSASSPAAPPGAHSTAAARPTTVDAGPGADRQTPSGAPTGAGTAVGPEATGAAAHGLCTAWASVADKGKAAESPAFRNLTSAAGGVGQIDAWCAALPPRAQQPSDHRTGKPSSVPTGKPTSVPTGKPTTVPPTRPAVVPTGKPTGPPTTHPTGRP